MKTFTVAAALLLTTSMPVIANAEKSVGSVGRAHCYTHQVDHPDGSSETTTKCFTESDGTR